jgi:hypothetical protein
MREHGLRQSARGAVVKIWCAPGLVVAESQSLKADQSAEVGVALMAMAESQRALGDKDARASAARAVIAFTRSLGPTHSETRRATEFRDLQ